MLLRLLRSFKIPTVDSFDLDDRAELTGNTDDAQRFEAILNNYSRGPVLKILSAVNLRLYSASPFHLLI